MKTLRRDYSFEILYYYKIKHILNDRIKSIQNERIQRQPKLFDCLKDKPKFVNKIKMKLVKCEYPVV